LRIAQAMAAPVAYRTSGDAHLRREGSDTGIGEMTAVPTDHRRRLPPERRESGPHAELPGGPV
jgi:hypothetical protein